jgi:hypothetical protein
MDVAWFSGLFEGEGCVGYYPDKRNPNTGSVRLQIESTDKDIIDRLVEIWGGKTWFNTSPSKPKHYKPSWRWGVSTKTEVKFIIEKMYPYLGERRRKRCDEVLERIAVGE